METTDQPIFKFKLAKVTTEQFALLESCFDETATVMINANVRFGADDEQNIVAVFTAFTFECNKTPFIIIEAGCHFMIEPESWNKMMQADKQELLVPKELLRHLSMITVGTTRGILHAKTENTGYNKYVLPTLNVSDMVRSDCSFVFKQL